MRILLITNTPPIPSWGGAMTLYRHFCEKDDFTISVITDDIQISKYNVSYPYMTVNKGKVWTKISNTRFFRLLHTYSHLVGTVFLPGKVLEFAADFKPDAIFTVAGSWSWMAILAKKVARKLNVPLIGSFNDWWYYNIIFVPWANKMIEHKFRQFYKDCNLALCTSDGMQKALGEHKNSVVLYPTGSYIKVASTRLPESRKQCFMVAFAGNLGEWYGTMLESLVEAAKGSDICFRFFGSNPGWSKKFDSYVKEQNIYQGQLPFEQLQHEIQQVDGLLLLMGFDESSAMIESTSFKTKFLDYLAFQKPIMLWGPSYCTAVAIAREFESAEICTSPSPADFLKVITEVKNNHTLQQALVNNATKMHQERFHPDKIHATLYNSIKALQAI